MDSLSSSLHIFPFGDLDVSSIPSSFLPSHIPFYTVYGAELLEGNSAEKYTNNNDISVLKNKTERKEVIAEVNAFVQAKLNTIADPNTIGEFNKTVKSKKILTKMITDEHYLTINNNTLQVVDGIKDAQGKPIDLDKRGHRKLVGMYLNYIATQNTLANPQKNAAADLISYINDLNTLAEEYDGQEKTFFALLKKLFHKLKKDSSPTGSTTDKNPGLATALNKDLNLDSKRYSYLGTKSNPFEAKKDAEVDDKIQEAIDKIIEANITLPTGVTCELRTGKLISTPLTNAGGYTANVELKKNNNSLGNFDLEMNDKFVITKAEGDNYLKKLYTVTLNDGKVTFVDIKEAEEKKKKIQELTTKAETFIKDSAKLTLPLSLTASLKTNGVTLNTDASYAAIVSLTEGTTSAGEMTLTFDANHGVTSVDGNSLTGYEATLTNGVVVVSKKTEEAKEEEKVIKLQELIDNLKISSGKKLLDLNDFATKTNLENAFSAIATKPGYTDIIKKTSDDATIIDLDATIKAFQAAYMKVNPTASKIGGKDGKPDSKVGPKTLAAIKSLLEGESSDEDGESNGSGSSDEEKKSDENEKKSEENEDENVDFNEKYKKEYSLLFDKYNNNTQSTIVIEEVEKDGFLLYIKDTNSGKDIPIDFVVSRDASNTITAIKAKGHYYPGFHQGDTYIEVVKNNNKIDYFYKIVSYGKDFLVGYDSSTKKWLYNVVATPPSKPIDTRKKGYEY